MFLKKRWSLLLLKHRRQTAKFQFVELKWAQTLVGKCTHYKNGIKILDYSHNSRNPNPKPIGEGFGLFHSATYKVVFSCAKSARIKRKV